MCIVVNALIRSAENDTTLETGDHDYSCGELVCCCCCCRKKAETMCRMSILVKQDRAADNGSFLLINNTLHLRLESLMILYSIKAHFCAILDKKTI